MQMDFTIDARTTHDLPRRRRGAARHPPAETLGLTPRRQRLDQGAGALYNVALFARVGRGIELTEAGRLFVEEARATLARAQAAALALSDLGGLKRGVLRLSASQTTASHWLPPRLMRFRMLYPGVEVD